MSRSPSPDQQQSWEQVAASMRSMKAQVPAQSRASEDRQSNNSHFSPYSSQWSTHSEVDTSDARAFPPPNSERARFEGRRAKREVMTGWEFRGENAEGKSAVNVLKRDAVLLDLAMEGKTTLEAQLKMCGKPIIGLDDVIEYIDPDGAEVGSPRVYFCTLCSVFRSVATIMEHLAAYFHRVRAIRKRFPTEVKSFLLPDGKTINRNSGLLIMAQKRAYDIELVYGRGEVQVRRERPVYPKDAMDAEDSQILVLSTGKNLEFLNNALTQFKNFRIESQEEYKTLNKLYDSIQESIFEWRVAHRQEDF